jgi:hypothetical protein
MQVLPGIFVHLALYIDSSQPPSGESTLIALPLSAEVAWKRYEQQVAL